MIVVNNEIMLMHVQIEAPLPQHYLFLGGYFVRILRQLPLTADNLAGYIERCGIRRIQVLYLPN